MRKLSSVLIIVALALGTVSAGQQTAPREPRAAQASATGNGFSAERLARLDRLFQQYVDDNRIAGAVALLLRDGKPVYEHAFGWSDKESQRRMTTDTVFRIASQSKAITSAAILSLIEEGKLTLNTPVS